MARPDSNQDSTPAKAQWFNTTHWSVVLAAGDNASPHAAEALEKLCRTYWYPLYAYVRRQGHSPEDAQDLTQAFFERFLEKKSWQQARREGKFRSFLLTSLKHFLINEWKRLAARKRGGGVPSVSLDSAEAERLYHREPADNLTPEKLYDRSWALTLLEQARERLREEYAAEGKSRCFQMAEQFLPGAGSELTYAEAARQLGIPEGTLKSEVHRCKRRYRDLLRAEIAHTVLRRSELDEELSYLLTVFSG